MKVLAVAIVMAALYAAYVSKKPEAAMGESGGGVSGSAAPSVVGGEAAEPSPGTPETVEPEAAQAAATNGGQIVVPGAPAVAEQVASASAGAGGLATPPAVLEQGGEPDDVRAERMASGSTVGGGGAVERAVPVPAPVAVFKRTASREGSVNGCSGGELVLSGSGLQFTCPSDSTKSVTLGLAEIERVDKSGVEANGHKKYHFNLQDADAAQGEQLFREWFAEARTTR